MIKILSLKNHTCIRDKNLMNFNFKLLFYFVSRKAQYNSHFFGVSFGMSYAIWFLVNAAAFRLGGHLVVRNEVAFEDMFK